MTFREWWLATYRTDPGNERSGAYTAEAAFAAGHAEGLRRAEEVARAERETWHADATLPLHVCDNIIDAIQRERTGGDDRVEMTDFLAMMSVPCDMHQRNAGKPCCYATKSNTEQKACDWRWAAAIKKAKRERTGEGR